MGTIIENLQDRIDITDDILVLMDSAVKISLEMENFKFPFEVSVMITDNEKIREINYEQRQINKPTDVLSFPIVDMYEGEIRSSNGDFDLDEGLMVLGDIVISIEKAMEQSKEYGHTFERELIFLLTHGVYHLLGYDHDTEEREKTMMTKQYGVLDRLNLKRS
ncbi:MAG: rRNA maturation RNase YbeY [Bacillota bacterium]